MVRTSGRRSTRPTALLAAIAITLGVAACGSDAAKEAAISQLAVGTWACEPAAPGASETPFAITIEKGAFSVEPGGPDAPPETLTGTWEIDDGDLSIRFDLRGDDATAMRIDRFDELTLDSTGFTMQKPGLYAPDLIEEDMTVEEMSEIAKNPPALDVDVEIRGARSITVDTSDGDPWTCDRQ